MAYAVHPHHEHSLNGLAHVFQPVEDLLRRVEATLAVWQERLQARHQLASLDDRMLQDIGLTRADVWKETEKPFWRA